MTTRMTYDSKHLSKSMLRQNLYLNNVSRAQLIPISNVCIVFYGRRINQKKVNFNDEILQFGCNQVSHFSTLVR